MDFPAIIIFSSALVAVAVAIRVAWKEQRSIGHWSFAVGMIVLAVESVFSGLAIEAVMPERKLYWQTWRLLALSVLPGIWLLFSLTYARGNYQEFLGRSRVLLTGATLLPIGLAALFRQHLIRLLDLTTSGQWVFGLALPGFLLNLLFLLSAVLVLMNLERTFRASVGTMRWRIKFMILGLGLLFAVRAYSSSQILVSRAISSPLQTVNATALLLACLLIIRSLMRASHFEVRVYPSHSVLHGSLTVMLAGTYLAIVGVLAKVVTFWGGEAGFALKAFLVLIALVVLTSLLLSDRVRLLTKRFISRHFQRPEYEYRTVWRAFTEASARQVETHGLCEAMVKLLSQVFQALSVSIWLVDDREENLRLGASTFLSEAKGGQLQLDSEDAAAVLPVLRMHSDPVDLDASREVWAVVLRRLHPDEFHNGGNRLCVPMLSGGELLGVIMLGDRVGGVPYSLQDCDLLKSVGDQAAAGLLNIRLAQQLAQARQMEAFQAMSAFFVHDLKNTASTLSLMLQNFPVHYQDPAFREDALRGLGKAAQHINDLIQRLSLLRRATAITPVESDLNEVVAKALTDVDATLRAQLVQELRPLPRQRLDAEQIQKVVMNLVLNAKEASSNGSKIHIETTRRATWTVLSVRDAGCGMSAEFVQRSLFRPFQTTKKQGIGIGMFQCKMIVEAHQGKIEVESEVGKGTTFRVLLPCGDSPQRHGGH